MRIVFVLLICMLYCVISDNSNVACWQTKTVRIIRDYHGENFTTTYTKAFNDIAQHFGTNFNEKIIPAAPSQSDTKVYVTRTVFNVAAKYAKLFTGHASVEFYNQSGYMIDDIHAEMSFDKNGISDISLTSNTTIPFDCKDRHAALEILDNKHTIGTDVCMDESSLKLAEAAREKRPKRHSVALL
ncbi:hypothetical protein KIN20_033222 [Parelaphostrongylus tenuis]|uniref:Uncharacterized protein n=1 Tax=Parelaphostrongylus tenuis TaxID=148309 RepID=A0AAD5R864_PARTN|nr:hypothetical protein KIN20_033222 [Parelaphostrongylus tenuis]